MLPFLSTEPMIGDPSYDWKSFKETKLRRFPSESSKFHWKRYIGSGVDGVVLRACLDDGKQVAVKFFRASEQPKPTNGIRFYWAFKRECHNCAILEMITTSMRKAPLAGKHIYIHPKPKTQRDAYRNLKAFSAEIAAKGPEPPANFEPFRPGVLPNTCLGWMEFNGQEIRKVFHQLRVYSDNMEGDIPEHESYFALVYSFVPEGKHDDAVIQSQMDFFYLVGFVCSQFKEDNWRGSGILVDFSDLVSALSSSWGRAGYGRLIKMMCEPLGVEMRGLEEPNFSQIFNEDSLEHNVLSKTLFPPINAALRSARKTLRLDHALDLDLGRSGRCYYNPSGDKRFYPDWSLVSEGRLTDGSTCVDLLPGDTKLAVKWQSSFYPHFQPVWKDPVRQILSYCDKLGVRYGFIITNAELVVFRFAMEEIGSGISRSRPTRALPQQPGSGGGYRVASGSTDISKLSDALQSTSLGGSSYQATDSGAEYHLVEYQAIPWTHHGGGGKNLTVRLALFYLSMMAGLGPSAMQTTYPPFDSWTCRDDGTLMHNTTGKVVKSMVSPDAVVRYHDPSARGPRWVTLEDSADYLTRASVSTLEVDRRLHRYYYVDENSNRVDITEDMTVLDEDSRQFGRFSGFVWQAFEEAGEVGESSRKRRKKK